MQRNSHLPAEDLHGATNTGTDGALGTPLDETRALWPALRKGWACTCPNCGKGALFQTYLKVADHCPECGTALYHQRADDGPAYIVILIVGHIVAPFLMLAYGRWEPNPWVIALIISLGTIALSLYLLPKVKGAFVALQWAKLMHGFGTSK